MNIPYASFDLIDLLNRTYPHKCPTVRDEDREIRMYAGRRALIDELVFSMNQQIEEERSANLLNR